jgi:copper chaperone NosL
MKRVAWLVLVLLGLALAACGGGQGGLQPPQIFYGEDTCAKCGMIISDPKFAAALLTTDRESRKYDDIGCMLDDYVQYGLNVAASYVHDYNSEAWLDAKAAFFVEADVHTPMASGLVAFGERAAAEAFAPGADVMTFDEVTARQTQMPLHADGH